jgi:PPOX class probable FMN-dependent enzyme
VTRFVGEAGEMTTPFEATLTDIAQLRDHYRDPNQGVLDKEIDHVDERATAFIAASTFVLVGTADVAGRGDISPKGGDPGFVRVLDPKRLAIPDLNGNNRLDSLQNIVANPHVGLLFLVPDRGETLRINGRAWVSVADDLLDSFTDQYRRPASVIGVEVNEVFLHCAKSVRRAGLWNPETWGAEAGVPSSGAILAGHVGLDGDAAASIDASLEEAYARDLEADRPA